MPTRERLATVAERAARAGGEYLRGAFRTGPLAGEYGPDDATTEADRAAERRVLDAIEAAFPDHAIRSEESGRRLGEGYEWVVDPLDGSNNFAAGLPVFATAVAVREGDRTVAAAIHEPLPETLYRARRGGGATVDGDPTTAESSLPLDRGTVSFTVGLNALRAERARARAAEDALRDRCKRVVRTWAPCVDWGLLATGSIEGAVAFRPEPYEHYAAALLAAESGAVGGWLGDDREWYVAAGDRETRRSLAAALPP